MNSRTTSTITILCDTKCKRENLAVRLLAQKPWIVPIPGTTKLTRLEENLGAVNVDLSSEDLEAINAAAARIEVRGARYSAAAEARIDR
jgi:aryl-alcohol dehydrogenase-like predicted oxidoreductase